MSRKPDKVSKELTRANKRTLNYVTLAQLGHLPDEFSVFKIVECAGYSPNRYQSTFAQDMRLEFSIGKVTLTVTSRGMSVFDELPQCLRLLMSLKNRTDILRVVECKAFNAGPMPWEYPLDNNRLSKLAQAIRPLRVVGSYGQLIRSGRIHIPRRYRDG